MLYSIFLKKVVKKGVSAFLTMLLVFEPFAANQILYATISRLLPYAVPVTAIASIFASIDAHAVTPPEVITGQNRGTYELNKFNTTNLFPHVDSGNANQINIPTAGVGKSVLNPNTVQTVNHSNVDVGASTSAVASGSSSGHDAAVNTSITRLTTEPSAQGDAYRAMINSKKRRINYTQAPFLAKSATVTQAPTPLLDSAYTGCTTSQTVTPQDNLHVDVNKKICTKVVKQLQACSVTRTYQIHPDAVIGNSSLVRTDNNTQVQHFSHPNLGGGGGIVVNDTQPFTVDTSNVQSVKVTLQRCDDECRFEYKDASNPLNPWVPIVTTETPYYGSGAPWSWNSCGERGNAIYMAGGPSSVPPIDITSLVSNIAILQIRFLVCVEDRGDAFADIEFKANVGLYEDKGFISNPAGCWQTQYDNAFCHADSWTCTDNHAVATSAGPITINTIKQGGGKAIWSDNTPFENTSFEATAACWSADAAGLCNFNSGSMSCFTAADGITQICPQNDGSAEQDSCQKLQDEGCVWESETCVDGAMDAVTGSCSVFKATYACSSTTTNLGGKTSVSTAVGCNSLRCMGTDCAIDQPEDNSSFGLINGLMGSANALGQDGACDANGCKIFSGKAMTCKTALGGVFDCCASNAQGINFLDYVKVAAMTYKVAVHNGWMTEIGMSSLPSIGTIGTTIATNTAATITQLTGSTAVEGAWTAMIAPQSGFSLGIAPTPMSVMGDMVTSMSNWVGSFFPTLPSLGGMFTLEVSSQTMEAMANAAEFAQTMMTAFMYAYLAYTLLSMVFACTNDEFNLDAQKQMKACSYIGSYCSGSTPIGVCYESSETWCCYGSALSRILQEQVRKQLGGMGTAKAPICDGLTPSDLANPLLDWKKVDLKEYEAMLVNSAIKPGAGQEDNFYGMDNITKVNTGATSGDIVARGGAGAVGINKVDSLNKTTGISSGNVVKADKISGDAIDGQMAGWPPP